MPVIDEPFCKISKRLPCTAVFYIALQCASKTKSPCSGIKESGSMCSILNIVGKCQRLFVIIEF